MAEPTPTSVSPWYLRNINQALALDSTSGEVYVRTGLSGGDIVITGPVTIPGTVTTTQGTTPWIVSGDLNTTTTFSTGSTDAFGRLRVSDPFTLFDSQTRYYDHQQFSSLTSTGGSVSYDSNSSTFGLTVTTSSGSSVIRETKRVFPYQPGKSLLIMNTFAMATPASNLRQRVGFFGSANGVYFEVVDSQFNMVIRSSSSGTLVEDRIAQSNWNGDRLDGTGPSGITLNPALDQIFWIDIEWLGVGTVRSGFVIDGQFILCHSFNHANISGNTTTYMTTATLPVRYEITNTGISTGGTMRQICSTVISEGGFNQKGTTETAGTGVTTIRLATGGTYYPIASIRLSSSRLDAIVAPRQVDILSPSVNYYRWKLVLNPTLTGATWTGTSSTGSVQYDTGATAISGGTELQSGFVGSRELIELGADIFSVQLGRTLAGVSDVVTLALTAVSNNADVLAQLGWQELT